MTLRYAIETLLEAHGVDTIRRQDAIDVLTIGEEMLNRVLDDFDIVGTVRTQYEWGLGLIQSYIEDIKELPSAQPERCEDCKNFSKTRLLIPQPERKKGKWIYCEHDVAMCDGYRCDKCGFFVPWDYQHKFIDFIKDYKLCPSCGADMRGEGGQE